MVPIEKELVNALYKPSQWQVTRRSGAAQSPQRVPDCQAQPAAAVPRSLRRARHAGELPTPRIQHARTAGARAAQRELVQPRGESVGGTLSG